jgi:hypothetical protein
LEANAAQQQRNFAEQQKRIDAFIAGLQKVSAQLELSKPTPQTVLKSVGIARQPIRSIAHQK